MSERNEEELKSLFENGLRTQYLNGLRQGTTAICAVVREKAVDTSKTADERLEDIVQFCDVSLGAKKK